MTEPAAGEPFDHDLYDEATLAAIEGWAPRQAEPTPDGISGWRRRSATGAVLGAALLGLGEAIEGRSQRERPPMVADDPGQPHDPEALVDLEFDAGSPSGTVAHLRAPRRPR